MVRVFQLIFAPFQTWERIVAAERSVAWILIVSALPLMAAGLAVEGWALTITGEHHGRFDHLVEIEPRAAMSYAVVHFGALLVNLFFGSYLVLMVTLSFGSRATFQQAFTVVAYGMAPVFLMRFLDAMPVVHTWVCWGIGVGLMVSTLYHGVAQVLQPDQTKGFGIYVVVSMLLLLTTGLVHFIARTSLFRFALVGV